MDVLPHTQDSFIDMEASSWLFVVSYKCTPMHAVAVTESIDRIEFNKLEYVRKSCIVLMHLPRISGQKSINFPHISIPFYVILFLIIFLIEFVLLFLTSSKLTYTNKLINCHIDLIE